MVIAPSPALPQVFDTAGALAASLHRSRHQAAADAVLLTHAPAMLNALHHAAEVFAAMARFDPGPSGMLAADTHAQLDKLLRGPLCVWSDDQEQVPGPVTS
jgi:hypothetical protein